MSPEVAALAAMFVIGAFIGARFEKAMARERRKEWRRKNRRTGDVLPGPWEGKHGGFFERVPDAADQLRCVMKADFKAQPLLNKSEARLFRAVDKQVIEARPGWQVMAQVSLGEILKCEDKAAYACINSKRVDLLIVDGECMRASAASSRANRSVAR